MGSSDRGIRGGNWFIFFSDVLSSSTRFNSDPAGEALQRWFPCRKSFVFRSCGARTGVVCSVDTAGDHGCGLSKAEEEITLSTFVLLPFVFRSAAGGGA